MKKNKQPLFSIITPTYNMGKFLPHCIESVLRQNYPHVEHIIQDACSTDQTISILKKYSSKKYRTKVRWKSEPDNGQIDGLNKAIQRASGDIILVLNADDTLMPYACSWAVSQFRLFPQMAVIYGDVYIINEKGVIVKIGYGAEYDFKKLLCVELVPPAQAAFIQRSYFKKVGLYADTTLDTCPDFEMWVRIGLKFPMKHVPGIISQYRVYPHDDSGAPRTAKRFYDAKRQVINQALDSPKTPQRIKELRARAYQGLLFWSAREALLLHNYEQAVNFMLKGFIANPAISSGRLFLRFFLDSPIFFTKYLLRLWYYRLQELLRI